MDGGHALDMLETESGCMQQQKLSTNYGLLATEPPLSGSSHLHCPAAEAAEEEQGRSPEQQAVWEDSGMEAHTHVTTMASTNAMPSTNQTEAGHRSHTTTAPMPSAEHQGSSEAEIDSSSGAAASVRVRDATEPTSTGGTRVDTDQVDGGRQENGGAVSEGEMTAFRSSDSGINQTTVNPVAARSVILADGTVLAELTRESPPSYESVMNARMLQPIIPTDEASTHGFGHDVVTAQPLSISSTVSQPAVEDHINTNRSDVASPELDSITAQLNDHLARHAEYTPDSNTCCTCISTSCQRLSDCCDACLKCCSSDEMKTFCECLGFCLLCAGAVCLGVCTAFGE